MLKFGFGVPRLGQKLPPITGGFCWRNNEGKYMELLQKTEISWRQEMNSRLRGTGKEFPAGLLDVEVFSRALLLCSSTLLPVSVPAPARCPAQSSPATPAKCGNASK